MVSFAPNSLATIVKPIAATANLPYKHVADASTTNPTTTKALGARFMRSTPVDPARWQAGFKEKTYKSDYGEEITLALVFAAQKVSHADQNIASMEALRGKWAWMMRL
jgi:hypothetical protein